MFSNQSLTMKLSDRTAQGFSPGFGMQNQRALKAAPDVMRIAGGHIYDEPFSLCCFV
jgi:hypothetical protein